MRLLSSDLTYFYTRVIPIGWFLGVIVWAALVIQMVFGAASFSATIALGLPLGLVAAFLFLRYSVLGLAEEVEDHGDKLRIRRRTQEHLVPIDSISSISYASQPTPPRVILYVNEIIFEGTSFSFMPESGGWFGDRPKIVDELTKRIKGANQPPQTRSTSGPA